MIKLTYSTKGIKKSLEKLEKRDALLFSHIKNAFRNILEDPVCGIHIPVKLIPKVWVKSFGINNLYKYNIPNGWRLLYSLSGDSVEIIAIILGCFNHKDYENLFHY